MHGNPGGFWVGSEQLWTRIERLRSTCHILVDSQDNPRWKVEIRSRAKPDHTPVQHSGNDILRVLFAAVDEAERVGWPAVVDSPLISG